MQAPLRGEEAGVSAILRGSAYLSLRSEGTKRAHSGAKWDLMDGRKKKPHVVTEISEEGGPPARVLHLLRKEVRPPSSGTLQGAAQHVVRIAGAHDVGA